jgi:excisionase family DNA binding protein
MSTAIVSPKLNAERLLTTEQAAEYLGCQPQTLTVWRSTGRHNLRYIRVGRLIRYRLADLDAWIEKRASDE